MLLVGSILPAGAGAQLWQLTGAAPDNIELNTTAGAAGILAELPSNQLFKLILANVAGQDIFIGGSVDDVNQVYSIVQMGDKTGGITYADTVLNRALTVDFDGNIANPDILITASDNNDNTNQQHRADYIRQRVTVLGVDTINTKLDGSYYSIQDGAETPVFQVKNDGKLETNQTAASIAVRVKVAEMPIYDTTGALVGYININT